MLFCFFTKDVHCWFQVFQFCSCPLHLRRSIHLRSSLLSLCWRCPKARAGGQSPAVCCVMYIYSRNTGICLLWTTSTLLQSSSKLLQWRYGSVYCQNLFVWCILVAKKGHLQLLWLFDVGAMVMAWVRWNPKPTQFVGVIYSLTDR